MPSRVALGIVVLASACSAGRAATPPPGGVTKLQRDAERVAPLVRSDLARRFLAATASLPRVGSRTLWAAPSGGRFYGAREIERLPDGVRRTLVPKVVDETTYFETRYGSPVSYARATDVLAEHGVAWPRRMFDFGYGYVGHLRMFASLGVDVVGVDVDPMLRALYTEPGDQGRVGAGTLTLLDGRFPADPTIRAAVGTGHDLVLSKNVLKKGYVHPDRPADPKKLIDLGGSDELVLGAFHAALGPRGAMLIYNVCPAPTPPDRPFVPWSDGRSPFSAAAWEAAGFEILAFDHDDTEVFRRFARALGWGDDAESPWDLEHDLSVLYTLVRRR